MEILLFAMLFLMGLFGFFMFLRLGKYTNRRRIMSYPIPEGWVETIKKTIPEYESSSEEEKEKINSIIKVMISEKQFILENPDFKLTNENKIEILARATMLSKNSIDPYLEKAAAISVGGVDSQFCWTGESAYAPVWNNPKAYASIGFENFSSKYRGVIAQWACYYPYHPAKFQAALGNMPIDKSLFPLFTEVWFEDRELLKEKYPEVLAYLDGEFLA
jgi:Mlc titration factor MtfA (ptsG expression regulator)